MNAIVSQVRPGAYYDSVVLMQLQRALLAVPGVIDAGAVMATAVNLELLAASGLRPEAQAGSDDLLIVIKADDRAAGENALALVDGLLSRRRAASQAAFLPKSLDAAARQRPEAEWVLISVPGRFAAGVARDALELRKNVFLYSDNVPLDDEVLLKKRAGELGLLVMGPDCGTAIIGGIGFGFANRVRHGPIGLVGASGTGLQAVTSAIHGLGSGISQAVGTGGRDLQAEVGAATTLQAIDALGRDPETRVIVVVSKPPSPEAVPPVVAAAMACGKPVVLCLIGLAGGGTLRNLHFAPTLAEAAATAVRVAGETPATDSPPPPRGGGRYLRGLFSGGTLAYETVLRLQYVLQPLHSNAAIHPWQKLDDPLHSEGHTILDLGADTFTVGRLHPMIDNDLRIRRLRQEAADSETAVVLLDVVLGEGAHPDPASELAPAIREVVGGGIPVVVAVIGTDTDPQGFPHQVSALAEAGAIVAASLSEALEAAILRIPTKAPPHATPVSLEALRPSPSAINVGLESFYDSLVAQGTRAVQVDWRPPAGGDERLMGILARMKAPKPAP